MRVKKWMVEVVKGGCSKCLGERYGCKECPVECQQFPGGRVGVLCKNPAFTYAVFPIVENNKNNNEHIGTIVKIDRRQIL